MCKTIKICKTTGMVKTCKMIKKCKMGKIMKTRQTSQTIQPSQTSHTSLRYFRPERFAEPNFNRITYHKSWLNVSLKLKFVKDKTIQLFYLVDKRVVPEGVNVNRLQEFLHVDRGFI
jgi:hypothetical protein